MFMDLKNAFQMIKKELLIFFINIGLQILQILLSYSSMGMLKIQALIPNFFII
jgi:hypothetical protein